MLENVKPVRLTELGTLTLSADRIYLSGFSANDCSCRDVVALALVWAIGELQRELALTLESPGAGKAGID